MSVLVLALVLTWYVFVYFGLDMVLFRLIPGFGSVLVSVKVVLTPSRVFLKTNS